jgi:BASS family bile acid:Na+ symporter
MFEKIDRILNGIKEQPMHFSESGLLFLNLTLAFIMFGVALGISKTDFKNILKFPKSIITGYLAQFLFLPLVTFLFVIIFKIPMQLSLGMILVAACPGGNISNFITSLAKGNVALSVSLTALSDLSSIIMTPLNFMFWGGLYVSTLPLAHPIEIPLFQVFKTILLLMGIPLLIGMWVSHKYPAFTAKVIKPIKIISIVAFLAFVIGAFASNFNVFTSYIWFLFPLVLVHNGLALLTGWSLSGIMRLSKNDRKTITIETGIQNSGLALVLIFNHNVFPEGLSGIAFVAGWWGIWHIVSGLTVGWIFGKMKSQD